MAYIIDTYNRFDSFDRSSARYKFEINGTMYAIKEVELEWGLPKLPISTTHDQDYYFIYDTYESAYEFARQMKSYN